MNQAPQHITHSISTATILRIIAVIMGVAVLIYLRDIVLVLLTSVVIASAIEPVARFLTKRGLPRIVAVGSVYATLIILILGLSYLLLPVFVSELLGFFNTLPSSVTNLNVNSPGENSNMFSSWQTALLGLSGSESLGQAVQNVSNSLNTVSGSILGLLTTVFGGVTSLLIIVVLSFYLSVQEEGIERFLRLVTPLHKEEYTINLWRRTQFKIGRWIQGQLLLGLIVAVLVFIALTLMGVENALFLAFVSGLFEIIPVFGAFIGSLPGVLTAVTQGGISFGLAVAFVYLIVQQIESNIIYPVVVQKIVNIEPLVVIIALIVGAKVGGFLGILLAVPIAAALTEYMGDRGKNRNLARAKIAENLVSK